MEDIREVDGMKLIIDWDLNHQMAFVFEIPTEEVRKIIPKSTGLNPYEVRPGVATMFLGYNDYNPGNEIYGEKQPAFKEITRVFMVQPNLSVNMPIPRFTFYMHRIASNNLPFVKQEADKLHLPTFYSPNMEVITNEDHTSAVARDEQGILQEWKNTNPNVKYYDDSFFGQYYVVENNKLYFGVFYWAGKVFTHQKHGDGGGIYEHPYLTEMEKRMPASSVGAPYLQMITTYGQPLVQRFYEPRLIREL
jgi:hypothetical protein